MRAGRVIPRFAAVLLGLILLSGSALADEAPDLSELDLSGKWYLLIHYKDERSQDKSITKFKDFAWAIEQTEQRMVVQSFPYVLFDEGTELVRRHAMTNHLPWEPDETIWGLIRQEIRVGQRAATKKRLKGSLKEGFTSSPGPSMGGLNTLSFERNWVVTFAPSKIRFEIIDSLSGGGGLEGMEESVFYEIGTRVSPDEFRGRYAEGTKSGTFRMVRTQEFRTR
jgi:hypothetical protein